MEFIETEEVKVLKEMYKNEYLSKSSKKISSILNKGKEFYEKALKNTKESFKHENNDVKAFNRCILEISEKLTSTIELNLYSSLEQNIDLNYDTLDQYITKIIFDSFSFQNREEVVKLDKLDNNLSFDLFLELEKYSIDASEEKVKETIYNFKQSFINKRIKQIKKKTAPLVAYYKVYFSQQKHEYSVLSNTDGEESIEKLFKDDDNLLEVLFLIQEKITEKLNEMQTKTNNSNSLESNLIPIENILEKFKLQNKFLKKIDLGKFNTYILLLSENPYLKNEIDNKIDLENKLKTIDEYVKEINHYIINKDLKNNDLEIVKNKMENFLSDTKTKVNNYIKIKEANKNKITNSNELIMETIKNCPSYKSYQNLNKIKYENLNDLLTKISSNNISIQRGQSNYLLESSFIKFYNHHILHQHRKPLDYDDLPLKKIVFNIINMIYYQKHQLDYSESLKQFNEKISDITELKCKADENVISDIEEKLKEKIIQKISFSK